MCLCVRNSLSFLYLFVKNLTSILNFSTAPKCDFSNNDTKALSLRDNHSFLFFIYLGITIMLVTNKQLINLLYNDVKNVTSILSCCIGPKHVSSNNGT